MRVFTIKYRCPNYFGKIEAPLNLHIQRSMLLTGGWQEIEEIKAGLIKLKRLT